VPCECVSVWHGGVFVYGCMCLRGVCLYVHVRAFVFVFVCTGACVYAKNGAWGDVCVYNNLPCVYSSHFN
jgi:hypothetical protein